jgi:hypothetical protein
MPEEAENSFQQVKSALSSETVATYPRSDRVYLLIVDAATGTPEAKGGLGAILCQTDAKGEHRVISYASRALTNNEKNYTPFTLKMQAACWGMNYFSTYLKGHKFILFIDHKPLEKLSTVYTKTLARINEYMGTYNFETRHEKGYEIGYYLSRHPINEVVFGY